MLDRKPTPHFQPARCALGHRSRGKAAPLVIAIIAGALVCAGILFLLLRPEPAPQPPAVETGEARVSAPPQRSPRGEVPEDDPVVVTIGEPEPRRTAPATDSPEGPVGIHAFPPLGTRPQLTGIIVPDDFELPPGYVRHYQSTDDGQMLAPILMFDPNRPPLDEFGQPIDIPADRIVPPELAPEGMPIDILEIPETRERETSDLRRLLRSG